MKKIDFKKDEWLFAQKVLDFFKQDSTCFNRCGKLVICPKYVVAMGDDVISAYYAACLAKMTYNQFSVNPVILCVGGIGKFSKYMNRMEDGSIMSEGAKLQTVLCKLGKFNSSVLDKSNNIGDNLREIMSYLAVRYDANAPIVFCLTPLLSKRIERTLNFIKNQSRGISQLNAYYYVPEEDLQNICQMYNGKAIANGLPLLSEIAALYERMNSYAGIYMSKTGKVANKDVFSSGEYLMKKYPLYLSRNSWTYPLQFLKIYLGVRNHQIAIQHDLIIKISEWKTML